MIYASCPTGLINAPGELVWTLLMRPELLLRRQLDTGPADSLPRLQREAERIHAQGRIN